jgi:hypothetical protein
VPAQRAGEGLLRISYERRNPSSGRFAAAFSPWEKEDAAIFPRWEKKEEPPMTPPAPPLETRPKSRWTPRRIGEGVAIALIAAGVVMLMQPISIELYGWSFAVTLTGTVLFMVGSKLPG